MSGGRECWRCGRPIDTVRDLPTCDPCVAAREARLAKKKRHDELRLKRALRLVRGDITEARKRVDRERGGA